MTVLALTTLGDATKNTNDPICVAPPEVAKTGKDKYHHRFERIYLDMPA
jgi:hypothetical protein